MLYYRRKILMAILEVLGKGLTAKQFQKYLFLFTRRQADKTYDFVPYKYGCFSFQANQDMQVLINKGYVDLVDGEDEKEYQLHDKNSHYLMELDMFEQQSLREIKKLYGNYSQDDLIKYTYVNYPFWAINSAIADKLLNEEELAKVKKQKKVFDTTELFTIGYEGLSLEQYITKLLLKDIRVLCDVRKNAYSQKYGFSKAILSKACAGANIEYIHVPDLGIESDKRQELKCQLDYDILFEEYERTTLKNNQEALLYVRSIIDSKKRVALTCFEKDPKQCHRTRVANALMQLPDINYTLTQL